MKKFLISFISILVGVILLAWVYLQTPSAQKIALNFLTELIESKTGQQLEIDSISFPLPFQLKISQLHIKDNHLTRLTVDEVKITVSPWALIKQTFSFNHVYLKNVHLVAPPTFTSHASTPLEPLSWDIVPYNLRISNLKIENLLIDPALLPAPSLSQIFPLNLEGSLSYRPYNHAAVFDLKATPFEPTAPVEQSATHLHLTCQGLNNFIFHFNFLENRQGILTKILGIKLPYDLTLKLSGKQNQNQSLEGNFESKFIDQSHVIIPPDQIVSGLFTYKEDVLHIQSIQGLIEPMHFHGDIALNLRDQKVIRSVVNLDIADLTFLKEFFNIPLAGNLKVNLSTLGPFNHLQNEMTLAGQHIKIQGKNFNDLSSQISFLVEDTHIEGHGILDTFYNSMRFKTDTLFKWEKNRIHLTSARADFGNAHMEGELMYHLDHQLMEGSLQASAEDTSILQSAFDVGLFDSKELQLQLNLSSNELHNQIANFSISTTQASYHEIRAEKVILAGAVEDLFRNPQAHLSLNAQQALIKGWLLTELTVESFIDQHKDLWPYKVHAQSSLKNELVLNSEGTWHYNPEAFFIQFDTLEGMIKSHPFKLDQPSLFHLQDHYFTLSSFALSVDKGFITAKVKNSLDQVETTLQIQQMPLEIFYPPHFKAPLSGMLEASVQLSGTPQDVKGQIEAHISHAKIMDNTFDQTMPFDATISGHLTSNQLSSSVQVSGITPQPIDVNVELPLHISLIPLSLKLNQEAPLSAHIAAQGEIAPLLQLLVIETTSFSGKAAIALDIFGTFNDPHIKGEVMIRNGTFESTNTGAVFHDLSAKLEANDKTLILRDFETKDLSEGIIRGNGTLELKKEEGFPFTLNLKLSRIRLINLDFAKAIASGDAIIKGTSRGAKVNGQLTTDSVQVTIPEESSALAYSVDVKYINMPKGEVSPVFTTSRPSWPVELNLQINVPKNATIKAKSLSSFWEGGLKVTGMAHAPQLFGDFKIIKGEYDFNGKTFDIKEGTITFAGDPEKKTTLYVIASKDLGKLVAEVIAKGPVKNPSIAFRSNPPMSQRDILSWILFGRGATDITPFQGEELSQSINNLAKQNNKGPDVLTKIRDKIGIDRIDINKSEGNESNQVSLQVGKYISKGVFVSVNKGITSEANQIGIEANLWPNIKAEAHVGDDSSTQLQLKWKKDY